MLEDQFRNLPKIKELSEKGYTFKCLELSNLFCVTIFLDTEKGVITSNIIELPLDFMDFQIDDIFDRMVENMNNVYLEA